MASSSSSSSSIHWTLLVAIASMLFVVGQALLRGSKLDPVVTAHAFIASMGAVAAVAWATLDIWEPRWLRGGGKEESSGSGKSPTTMTALLPLLLPAVGAGTAFYAGNLLWVGAIKSAPNIAFVRVLMAGIETALLLGVALLLFGQRASLAQVALTLGGMALLVGAASMTTSA